MDDRWFRLGDHGRYPAENTMPSKLQFSLLAFLLGVTLVSVGIFLIVPEPDRTPPLLKGADVTPETLAQAANFYISIGETATREEFETYEKRIGDHGRSVDFHERIGWLCRILYVQKELPIRAPEFGVLSFPHKSNTPDHWPLFPLAQSGDTFCVLSQGYLLGGKTESIGCMQQGTEIVGRKETISEYLALCQQHGTFRTKRIPVPSRSSAVSDIAALLESNRWREIQWHNDVEDIDLWYNFNEDWFAESLSIQAKAIGIPTK